jgi:predicted nucleotidyltransferase
MSADPKGPPAPRLRAIREAWLGRTIGCLEADPAVSAAGLVGSLGRGDADDWSDIDLLIVVPDGQVDQYADVTRLPWSEQVTWSIDARHNAPRGAGAIGARYVIDGLPLHVDWYVYPISRAAWVADAKVIFDRDGLPRLNDTFYEHQEKREVQPPAPKAANAHRLLQLSLVPVAGKYVARRSPGAGRMVEFVGGPHAPEASPEEHLAMLRRLLVRYRDEAPAEMLAANSRYLDLIEAVL